MKTLISSQLMVKFEYLTFLVAKYSSPKVTDHVIAGVQKIKVQQAAVFEGATR